MWIIESESINISSFEDYIHYNIIQKGDGENCHVPEFFNPSYNKYMQAGRNFHQ